MMKHSLYLKFILAYIIFGFLSFFTIAVFSSQMTLNYLTEKRRRICIGKPTIFPRISCGTITRTLQIPAPWLRFIPISGAGYLSGR